MWYDADIDARDEPHRQPARSRPAASSATTRWRSASSARASRWRLLGLATNWLAAGLLAFTIFFYAVIYTMWLKRSTPQNIVIGGAAGAFPPMIGWAAVTGTVSIEPCVLFLIIFLWTPPHFWALALYKQGDYGAAGIPMLPNVAGEPATKLQILLYSVVLVATTLVPRLHRHGGLALHRGRGRHRRRRSCWLAWRLFRTATTTPMKQGRPRRCSPIR